MVRKEKLSLVRRKDEGGKMTTESEQLGLTQGEQTYKHKVHEQHEHHHEGSPGPAHGIAESAVPEFADHHPQQNIVSRLGHFVLHYVEMCLAMCIGGISLNVLFFGGAALLGYTNIPERYPEFSILMIGILLAIPMAAWMRFRGHDWRSTLEMSSTSIVLAILLIGAAWLGALPKSEMLEWIKRLACPVMLIPMVLRLDLYTGNHASHARQTLPETA